MADTLPRLTLYSRPGCHLCDVAKERIETVRKKVPSLLDVVDISTDDALARRYGERIPVLLLDGEEVFAYRINPAVLERRLTDRPFSKSFSLFGWLRKMKEHLSG